MKRAIFIISIIVLGTGLLLFGSQATASAQQTSADELSGIEALGKALFYDPTAFGQWHTILRHLPCPGGRVHRTRRAPKFGWSGLSGRFAQPFWQPQTTSIGLCWCQPRALL